MTRNELRERLERPIVDGGWINGSNMIALLDECDRLEAENKGLRETAREASVRLRAVSGMPNDGPKDLLDYVADIEAALEVTTE